MPLFFNIIFKLVPFFAQKTTISLKIEELIILAVHCETRISYHAFRGDILFKALCVQRAHFKLINEKIAYPFKNLFAVAFTLIFFKQAKANLTLPTYFKIIKYCFTD